MSIYLSLNIKPPKTGVKKKITFMPVVQKVFMKKIGSEKKLQEQKSLHEKILCVINYEHNNKSRIFIKKIGFEKK